VAGLNRLIWDLRIDPPVAASGGTLGPRVAPGTYQIRLSVEGKPQTIELKVLMDPRLARVKVTEADIQQQFDLLERIKGAVAEIHRAVAALKAERARRAPAGAAPPASGQADELTVLERELIGAATGGRGGGRGRGGAQALLAEFTSLYNFVGDSEDKPTAAAMARWTALRKSLDDKLAQVAAAIGTRGGVGRP
jgi:hypothetical protein